MLVEGDCEEKRKGARPQMLIRRAYTGGKGIVETPGGRVKNKKNKTGPHKGKNKPLNVLMVRGKRE